jgi:hypothetical protein
VIIKPESDAEKNLSPPKCLTTSGRLIATNGNSRFLNLQYQVSWDRQNRRRDNGRQMA